MCINEVENISKEEKPNFHKYYNIFNSFVF